MTEVADLWSPVRPSTSRVAVAAAFVVAESARRARRPQISATEEQLFRLANRASPDLELPVWAVMQSGSLAAVFVVSGGLAKRGRLPEARAALVGGVGVWAGMKLIKPLIGRGRPESVLDSVTVRGQRQTGLGYPSGHAAVALTLALAITGSTKPIMRAAAVAVAAATGIGRMYVGAHLPLDVAGGLGIGVLCGRAARSMVRTSAQAG